jgi:hypothetical protein
MDVAKPGKQEVYFTISRDAGKFDCEGYIKDGEGAGLFRFTPDPKFAGEMASLGFSGVDDEKQYSMAVMDVTLAFAKEMKSEKVSGLDTDKLIAFRIFPWMKVHRRTARCRTQRHGRGQTGGVPDSRCFSGDGALPKTSGIHAGRKHFSGHADSWRDA